MTNEERDGLLARIRDGKHLPRCMHDFHDAKDVFKSIHDLMEKKNPETCGKVNWVDGQCYVIDVFLKFMALHGYELRKSRRARRAFDLDETIKERREREAKAFNDYIAGSHGTSTSEAHPPPTR